MVLQSNIMRSAQHSGMKKIFFGICLGFLSIILIVLCSEGLLRRAGKMPLYINQERKIFWKYDPLLGWRHQPGQQGLFEKPRAFRTKVSINSKGLRDQEYSYARIPGKHRILVLGDSLTWGFGVEQQEMFSEVLENMSKDVEVINAGVSGYSTDQELLWFKTEGVRYAPDLVILVFCGNDDYMNSLDLVYETYYKPRFRLDSQERLILQNVPVPHLSFYNKTKFQLRQYSALINFLSVEYGSALPGSAGIKQNLKPFRLTLKIIGEIRKIADTLPAKFMIVSTSKFWMTTESYADFITALKADRFPVIDIESCKGYFDEQMELPGDTHWNKTGHRFVAKEIFQFISDKELFSDVK